MEIYKFRSTNYMIDEIENEIIYFSPKEDLNDPIEGYIKLYFNGDEMAWKGLFKNYFISFYNKVHSFFIIRMIEESQDNESKKLLIELKNNFRRIDFYNKNLIPLKDNKIILPYEEYIDKFLNLNVVKSLISNFSTKNMIIDRNELLFFLQSIHFQVVKIIYEKINIKFNFKNFDNEVIDEFLNNYFSINLSDKSKLLREYNEFIKSYHYNLKLEFQNTEYHKMSLMIFIDFPSEYVKQLEYIMFPNCYISCFSKTYSNSSMWGNYSENHKGIVLIFDTKEYNGKKSLEIESVSGFNSDGYLKKFSDMELQEVKYDVDHKKINFFDMLGNFPIPQIDYLFSEKDKRSSFLLEREKDINEWRKKYNEILNNIYLVKTKDWKSEEEYRILLRDILGIFLDVSNRRCRYNFKSLKGIILGMKTSESNKIKIIDIISKKCSMYGIKDFKIYQAYFDEEEKNIKINNTNLFYNTVV
ncbi:DUF2971 domain-containing protein [Brachyspira intermedia]|uniref:DUF2971 domain-containing protein n=1 Tax=Brachyspira intermedia TaxID=84377 RepID=UPI0030044F58